ncbi:MAG TPA: 3-dehydroquinate synthase [Clostridiales bacterium]|nr:3-dehydroquinate synthase [Clostridiales bacterium]
MEGIKEVWVNLPGKRYPILCGRGLLARAGQISLERQWIRSGRKVFIITDTHVGPLYAGPLAKSMENAGFSPVIHTVEAGEGSKDFDGMKPVFSRMIREGITREDKVLALGGGVAGDFAGFIAHIYMRGIGFLQFPTSLLAQVDSSVGGKVAVNLDEGKNLIGGFCHPDGVISDMDTLHTLPSRQIADGMAEVIKYALIGDRDLFARLAGSDSAELMSQMDDIVVRCCEMKRDVVERDEKDTGDRMILNFGHTFGHIIEKSLTYGFFTHGEAIAVGMYRMALAGEKLAITRPGTAESIRSILIQHGLPWKLTPEQEEKVEQNFQKTLRIDKKGGQEDMTIIMLKSAGHCFRMKITHKEVEKLWQSGR